MPGMAPQKSTGMATSTHVHGKRKRLCSSFRSASNGVSFVYYINFNSFNSIRSNWHDLRKRMCVVSFNRSAWGHDYQKNSSFRRQGSSARNSEPPVEKHSLLIRHIAVSLQSRNSTNAFVVYRCYSKAPSTNCWSTSNCHVSAMSVSQRERLVGQIWCNKSLSLQSGERTRALCPLPPTHPSHNRLLQKQTKNPHFGVDAKKSSLGGHLQLLLFVSAGSEGFRAHKGTWCLLLMWRLQSMYLYVLPLIRKRFHIPLCSLCVWFDIVVWLDGLIRVKTLILTITKKKEARQ